MLLACSAAEVLTLWECFVSRFVLLVFSAGSITSGILWISFSPIADEAKQYFNIGNVSVSLLGLVFLITYPVGALICSYLAERSLYRTLVLAFVFTFLCGVLRLLGSVPHKHVPTLSFPLTLVGQIVGGLGQPTFTNLPLRLAVTW